jgi:phosphate-selective porin OprO/OprP
MTMTVAISQLPVPPRRIDAPPQTDPRRSAWSLPSRRPLGWLQLAALGIAMSVVCAPGARAQSEESEPAPALGKFEAEPLPPPEKPFLVPDLSASVADQVQVKSRTFTLKVGLVLIEDYTSFSQDTDSRAQVGEQSSQWDIRAARLMLHGTIGQDYRIGYLVAGEYKGFESDPDSTWDLTDVALTFPLGGPATKLTVGKTKETFDYEMVGDSGSLPQQERVLNPFFVSRNIGVKVIHVTAGQRMTIAAGVFNDWWVGGGSFADSGTDFSARLTGLAWDQPDGTRFLHLGVSYRYAGADNDTLRYRGRPEINVGDYYVDTGNLAADHASHLGLEALWNEGSVSLLSEYNRAWVSSPASGNPVFSGCYVTASWVLTGETRPYDRTTGYARRVMPKGRWGAPELVARFSHEDLDDGAVQGGAFDKTYLGLNWWATRRWKTGIGWGRTWLHRFGTTGVTDSIQTRLQWIF